MPAQSKQLHPDVVATLSACRRAFWSVAFFSGAVNLLMLAGPLYMLQVYDRVLSSRSVPTLLALSVFLAGAYAFQGALDLIRGRIVVRAAALLDSQLGTTVHAAVVKLAVSTRQPGVAVQPVRDLDQIRTFLTSAGPIAIVDLPWMPVFLFICFLIHPWLLYVALVGAAILVTLTILTETTSRMPGIDLARESSTRAGLIESDRRNSESIVAMGMTHSLAQRWATANGRYLAAVGRTSDVIASYASVSRAIRLLLQSSMLGVGAYLVIRDELSAGGMIAASIMMGRALAPIETAIANWRAFVAARQSVTRLSAVLARLGSPGTPTPLPPPSRDITVEQVTIAAPGMETPILRDLHFRIAAGEVLGIIGPSGAGKTSLLRTLTGIWQPLRGVVRLDGAALDQWNPEELGRHIGFVSQTVDLFDGTIAENISRMTAKPDGAGVLRAAAAAGAGDMILRLPQGYDTQIGDSGAALSAGQRQRIALARALYGDPFLIALDEAHANLDAEGEAALHRAILDAKKRGAIVMMIAHRPTSLATCDKVLYLANGTQQAFGPRDEILQKVLARPPLPAPATNLKIVSDSPGKGSEP